MVNHTRFKIKKHKFFMQWILHLVLKTCEGRISTRMNQIRLLFVDIVHYLFNYTRKEGWTTGNMEHGRNLFDIGE
jgi:hypothetical protein